MTLTNRPLGPAKDLNWNPNYQRPRRPQSKLGWSREGGGSYDSRMDALRAELAARHPRADAAETKQRESDCSWRRSRKDRLLPVNPAREPEECQCLAAEVPRFAASRVDELQKQPTAARALIAAAAPAPTSGCGRPSWRPVRFRPTRAPTRRGAERELVPTGRCPEEPYGRERPLLLRA